MPVGPTDEVGDVFARYVSLTLRAVGLIFIYRPRVQHPAAVLGWDSDGPGLQAKPSGSACTCVKKPESCMYPHRF